MRLQFLPSNLKQSSDRAKESKERSSTTTVSKTRSERDTGKNSEEDNESHDNGEEEDEEMVVDLELPPGRYSFQMYDYERFLRLRKQLKTQSQTQGTTTPEQDRQQRRLSQLPGILKKQSAYSASNSNNNDDNNSISNNTISSSRSARRSLQQSTSSSFTSYVASFTSSLLGWAFTASSNNAVEETNIDDDTTRILLSDETIPVSNTTVSESSRSLPSSSLLPSNIVNDSLYDVSSNEIIRTNSSSDAGPNENQGLIDKVYHLQIQLHRKQNAYKKAKKSRQMEDKRLLKLAQQLQTVDVDHLKVQRSIAELETTNEELETSFANYQYNVSGSNQPQEQPHISRYQEDQQRKLKMLKHDYELLTSRNHREIEKLHRNNQSTINSLKQRLLHETIELQRLVQLSHIKQNNVDHR
mmetsp:Transcript_22484/g.53076  ORF Transcript_22484/g.53076 Transcript_22484/m.53076 type:complete len:413 (-) Transcript_22484:2352-3590(-)